MAGLTVAVKDNYGKSLRLAAALQRAGCELVSRGPADVLLIDYDAPDLEDRGRLDTDRALIERYKSMGAAVLLYPHGGNPPGRAYDGQFEPCELVDGNLVHGYGGAELLRRVQYPMPTHVIGWTFCEMRELGPRERVRRVLFAPTHPNACDGTLDEESFELNREVFEKLLAGPWELTVRHCGEVEQNGLWRADGVAFTRSNFALGHDGIDDVDVVVAGDGTLPAIALARGVPVVIADSATTAHREHAGMPLIAAGHPERYRDYLRYPFDASDGPLDELVYAAARGERAEQVVRWRERFIGESFDEARFVALVERVARYGPAPVSIDPTRAFTVAGLLTEVHEQPELLAAYARCFGPDDDVTLALWAPGLEADAVMAMARNAVAAVGLDEERLPEVLLLALPGCREADRQLAERADALLSAWPPVGRVGELPRYDAAGVQGLRALAERRWGRQERVPAPVPAG